MVLSIRVKDLQKSLDFYTETLGLQIIDKLILENGKMVYASVGFDSTLITLLPIEHVQTQQMKEDLTKNKLGIGVEFYIGMNGSKKIDEFFGEVKTKGITLVNEPKTEFWRNKLFTLTDPDGYTISFRKRIDHIAPQRPWVTAAPAKRQTRHRKYDSIFSTR